MNRNKKGDHKDRPSNNLQSHYNNTHEIIDAFREAMEADIGASPDTIEADGKGHRFSTNGKRGDKAGRYILHIDTGVPAGYYECHRQGIKRKWKASGDLVPQMTAAERDAIRQRAEQQRKQREADTRKQHEATAEKAVSLWRAANTASGEHPYLQTKQIQGHIARQRGNTLLIPVYDVYGRLWSIQRIYGSGQKSFLKGGRKRGLFCLLNGKASDLKHAARLLACEGFATGCTIAEMEKDTLVCVCFDAGNLMPVIDSVLQQVPDLPITIIADDDRKTERDSNGEHNPGKHKAQAVADKYPGVSVVLPDFPDDAPIELSDFNDLAVWNAQQQPEVKP